ncbi:hypothetical protein B5S30_g1160 [[Candida] boidinii]|nr:hypothetical protein B5S27_g2946 [[Candida] boidinii]OWB65828.1 hypothetical protein B5S30_g1160 [[Candida] boidinii]
MERYSSTTSGSPAAASDIDRHKKGFLVQMQRILFKTPSGVDDFEPCCWPTENMASIFKSYSQILLSFIHYSIMAVKV